jgi:hypothetical protein
MDRQTLQGRIPAKIAHDFYGIVLPQDWYNLPHKECGNFIMPRIIRRSARWQRAEFL